MEMKLKQKYWKPVKPKTTPTKLKYSQFSALLGSFIYLYIKKEEA